jgi:hypothetical protein
MAAPVAAVGGGVAAAGGGGMVSRLGMGLLNEIIAELISGAVGSAVSKGGITPSSAMRGSDEKYMVSLGDIREIERYVSEENYRRSMLNKAGGDYKYLDADQIIKDTIATNRVRQQGNVQSALAQSLGAAIGQGLSSTGGIYQQGIATGSQRFPGEEAQIVELGRAY